MPSSVAIVGMWQETNTYSPRPTGWAQFADFELLEGAAVLDRHRGKGTVIGGFLDGLGPLEPVGVMSAGAWPSGPPDAATAARLLELLERALAAAPEVDGVLVNLHGAMVADGFPDMEDEVLRRIRDRFGAVPLVTVLDLHANPSAASVARCDGVVGYRTYPHVDMHPCGVEAAGLVRRALGGRPIATAIGKLAALTSPIAQGSDDEPMRSLLERAQARADAAGLLRISLLPGFPYSDVERAGFAVTAVADAGALPAARAVVAATLADVEAELERFDVRRDDPATAVARALAAPAAPVILADVADNIVGGGPGDGTALLAELLAAGAQGAVVLLVDADAAAAAHRAGAGAVVELELGARSDALHGAPVAVRARVARLTDGRYRSGGSYMTGQEFSMGPTAVLEVDGVTVVTMSLAVPPFHVEQLTASGVDPAAASAIVVKGAVAWRAPYGDVMADAIQVATPGCCPADPAVLPRTTVPVAIDPEA